MRVAMEKCCAVLVTVSDDAEGERIARALLEARLVACANRIPGVVSTYWWQGNLETSSEVLLVLKTRTSLLEPLIAAVKKAHSYSVPEVIALPLEGGNPDYLRWLATETKQ
ncbi:MAG: divalent-cation tolerance protein CutA [Candidatus Xenobia bacterium]